MNTPPTTTRWNLLWKGIAVALFYFLGFQVGHELIYPGSGGSILWLNSGFLLAILLSTPRPDWIWYLAPAALVELVCNLQIENWGLQTAVPCAALAVLEPLLGALLLQLWLRQPFQMENGTRLFQFVLVGGVLAPGLSAALGSLIFVSAQTTWQATVGDWWASHVLGVILAGPLTLVWIDNPTIPTPRFKFWLIILLTTWYSFWSFGPWTIGRHEFLKLPLFLLPLLGWISTVYGKRGASLAAAGVCLGAIWGTVSGNGLVAALSTDPHQQLAYLQRFMGVGVLAPLLVSFVIERQQRIERDLRDQFELMQSVINGTGDSIFAKDLQGRYILVNIAACEFMGLTPEKVLGHTDKELFGEKLGTWIFERDQDAVRSGKIEQYEFDWVLAEKKYRLISTKSIFKNNQGEVSGVVGSSREVSAKRAAQRALVESERRFRALADLSPTGIFETDTEGNCTFVNRRWCELAGLTPAEAMGTGWSKALYEEDRERVYQAWAQYIQNIRPEFQVEYRFITPAGKISWVLGQSVRYYNESGEVVAYLGNLVDITDRKEAEEVILASEQRFRHLAAYSPVGIFEMNNQGECTYLNQRWSDITGLTLEDGLGQGWLEGIHPADREFVLKSLEASIQKDEDEYYVETRQLLPTGQVKWVIGQTTTLRDEYGRRTGVIGTVTDVTEQELTRQALKRANEDLEQKVQERTVELSQTNTLLRHEMQERAKAEDRQQQQQTQLAHVSRVSLLGEMAAELAHELNQPLYAISTYMGGILKMLKSGNASSEALLAPLLHVSAEADRAAELVRRTRNFAGRRETNYEKLSLNHLLQESVKLMDFEARQRKVQLELTLAQDLPAFRGDSLQIQQIMVNLLRNAFDAVIMEGASQPRVCVRTLLVEECLELQVQDFGPGIAPEVADKLFEAYFTTKKDGLGLGLTISRSIAEAHEGRLWADSPAPGRGTTFHLTLPWIGPTDDDN